MWRKSINNNIIDWYLCIIVLFSPKVIFEFCCRCKVEKRETVFVLTLNRNLCEFVWPCRGRPQMETRNCKLPPGRCRRTILLLQPRVECFLRGPIDWNRDFCSAQCECCRRPVHTPVFHERPETLPTRRRSTFCQHHLVQSTKRCNHESHDKCPDSVHEPRVSHCAFVRSHSSPPANTGK